MTIFIFTLSITIKIVIRHFAGTQSLTPKQASVSGKTGRERTRITWGELLIEEEKAGLEERQGEELDRRLGRPQILLSGKHSRTFGCI